MSNISTVVVIDLDGTIIGDISPQILSYELWKTLKTSKHKYNLDVQQLRDKLQSGLIRQGFGSFIRSLKNHIPSIEFFVYTASEKNWAEFIIKQIEIVLQIKFNRPIFSRNHCFKHEKEYRKSTQYIKQGVLKCLRKKHNNKLHNVSSMLIIDNNNVYNSSDHKHLLICPSYNFRIPENICANINQKCFEENYQVIITSAKKYLPINLSITRDYFQFQKEFYTYYIQYIDVTAKLNSRYIQDTFWNSLKGLIITENIQSFTEKNIKFLQRALYK